MNVGGLLPRPGSNSNIAGVNGMNGHSGQWQQPIPSSSGFKKLHGKASTASELGCCSRLHRMVSGRRVGMLFAAFICLLSFLMLLNIASRVSVHFKLPADKETALQVMNSGRILISDSDTKSIHGTNMATRLLSEESVSKANSMPEMHSPSFEDHTNLPSSLLSSDHPLPSGHPCQGFTLPPPPTDKKRTGPRPCPVCYLPVKKAIEKMPPTSISSSSIIKSLSYVVELSASLSRGGLQGSEFGGHPSLEERNKSFQIHERMNVHCGFVKGIKPGAGTGFDIDEADLVDMDKCTGIVVASAIFGNYDLLQQPKNISPQSRKNICFFMFVDEETQQSLTRVSSERNLMENGLWRVVVVHNMPYLDPRRNGKIPKLLLHRLFPNARFSLWIDGKLELVVDPYQVLERFLWRRNQTFAISQHYKRLDVFEEAEANKAAGKYDNASIDAQVDFYQKEGIGHYDTLKSPFRSDVPEGCVIIREHTPISNLFTCLWFNEVDRFTSRDQLSFAIVRDKLIERIPWRLNMFLDCERRNFVVQAYHKELLEQRKSFLHTYLGQPNGTHMDVPVLIPSSKDNTTSQHARHTPLSRKGGPRKHRRASTI